MTAEEFESWLQKGLGRAAVFLKTHDSKRYRGVLLYACTHDLRFDRQVEYSRAQYLRELIEITQAVPFYRDGIVAALGVDDEEMDLGQLFEIAGNFAEHGDAEMKRTMYAAFDRGGFLKAGLTAAKELVRLDGLEALLFVSKTFDQVDKDERWSQFGILLAVLEKRDGKRPLPAELAGFAREWQEIEQLWKTKKPPEPRPDYESLKRSLTTAAAATWARDATPEQFAVAAEDFLVETDPKRQLPFLRMFMRHPFPGRVDRLIELARSGQDRVPHAARIALRNVHDPKVRALGLELNNIGLLIRNSEPGDYGLLEDALLETSIDPNDYHWRGGDVLHFVEAHPSAEAERTLRLLYENTPCAHCRFGAVTELIKIDRLPDWIREECRYDAYSSTRELVS